MKTGHATRIDKWSKFSMVDVSFKWQLCDYAAHRDETNNNYAETLSDSGGGDVTLIQTY